MKKQILFTAILFLVFRQSHSQNFFERVYDFPSEYISGRAVLPLNSGYILWGTSYDSTGVGHMGLDHNLLIRVDSLGDTLWTSISRNNIYYRKAILTSD